MKVLMIDTSSDEGLLALAVDGRIAAEVRLPNGPGLSKNLSVETQKLLTQGVPELIVAGEGPGSLTGIRVGLALAQGLALGWGIPLLRVGSLSGFPEEIVVIDARSSGLYVRLGDAPPQLLPPAEAEALLRGRTAYSPHPERIGAFACAPTRLDPLTLLNKSGALSRMDTPATNLVRSL